jgi:hypothetical protein
MTFFTEHKRMKAILDLAERLCIEKNSSPEALYAAGNGGFNIWCTPEDHPQGWEGLPMIAGAFAKPCESVASVLWGWENEAITHVVLTTDAFALMERDARRRDHKPYAEYRNRREDLEWSEGKIAWLFQKAGLLVPIIKYE